MESLLRFVKKNIYLITIILISLLPTIPFFITHDLLHTHDGLVHLPRLAAYFHALTDGHFPVRFAGYLNYGYGLPLFNFIYQTPYLIGSLLLLIGFNLMSAFKISLSLSFLLSGIFMYLFAREYFEDEKKGLLVAVFYQFAPFRMVEYLVRGSFGEVYTYAFFPLILYGLTLLLKKYNVKGFLITSFATAMLVISHNSVSLLFAGAAILFLIFTASKIKNFIYGGVSIFLGILIASFYWVPAILEHKYTYGNLYMENLYKEHFVPIQNFFLPNFNNSSDLHTGGISTFVGLFHIIAVILAIFVLRRKIGGKTKRLFFFSFTLLVITFFFILPISSFIWGSSYASLLRQFQFPWRFLSLVVVATSMLGVSFLCYKKVAKNKWIYFLLIILIVVSVAMYWKASLGYKKIDEKYYWDFPLNTTYYGETDVIWSAGPAKSYPKSQIEIVSGKGEIKNIIKKNHVITFTTESSDYLQVVSNTQFYPGWKAYVDGGEVPIQFQDPNYRGLLVFSIPRGEHAVVVKFGETKFRLIADMVSLFSLLLLAPLALLMKRKS